MKTIPRLAWTAGVFLSVLSAVSSPVFAQPATVHSFSELPGRLNLNDKAHVTDITGQHVIGVVLTISDTELKLRLGDGTDRTFLSSDVSYIYKERLYTRRGVIAGTSVGVAAGLLGLMKACSEGTRCESNTSQATAVTALLVWAAGMGVAGGTIGSLSSRLEPVYAAPGGGAQRRVALVPVVSPSRQGVLLSIRF